MHLSVMTDAFASDSFDEALQPRRGAELAHRDGVLRGLALLGIAAVLLGLTLLSSGANADRFLADGARPGAQHVLR